MRLGGGESASLAHEIAEGDALSLAPPLLRMERSSIASAGR